MKQKTKKICVCLVCTKKRILPVLARRSLCAIIRGVMQRFRALLLLSALLTMPVSILAASVLSAAQCCCCGSSAMCPMHRSQKSQQEKMPCHGTGQSQPTCMCNANQQNQPVILQFAPKATVNAHSVVFLSAVVYELGLFHSGPALISFVSPPEQPPRS